MLNIHFDTGGLGVCHNILYNCQCISSKFPHYIFFLFIWGNDITIYPDRPQKRKKNRKILTPLFFTTIFHALTSS